jgi:hypothetical protein
LNRPLGPGTTSTDRYCLPVQRGSVMICCIVPTAGLEPARLSARGFESRMSAIPSSRHGISSAYGIRTRDIQLERLASWTTRRTRQATNASPVWMPRDIPARCQPGFTPRVPADTGIARRRIVSTARESNSARLAYQTSFTNQMNCCRNVPNRYP